MSQFEHERRQRYPSEVTPACAGFAQLVKFGMELCPRLFGDVLQFSEYVLVRFPVAVHKQSFGIAALATFPDSIGALLIPFVGAGLLLLAITRRGRPRQ